MAEPNTKPITERELREAELQMTGRPPASATGFIGFKPAVPGGSTSSAMPPQNGNAGGQTGK